MSELKYINLSKKEHFAGDITINDETELIDLIKTSNYINNMWYERGSGTIKNVSFGTNIKSLQELYMNNNNIGSDGAKALAGALYNLTSLHDLYLNNNNIGDDGAKALAGALQNNTSQTYFYLHLNNNNIGDDGAKALAGALQNKTKLLDLYLNNNNIGNDGAKALAGALQNKTYLYYLALNNNNIGNDGAKALVGALQNKRNLYFFELSNNSIMIDGNRYYYYLKLKNPDLSIEFIEGDMNIYSLVLFSSNKIEDYTISDDRLFLVDNDGKKIIINFSSDTSIDLSNIDNNKVKILLYDIVSANNIDLKVSKSETILNDIPITPIYKSINITGEGISDSDIKSFSEKLNKVYEFTDKKYYHIQELYMQAMVI
jgi:hypothetical protein